MSFGVDRLGSAVPSINVTASTLFQFQELLIAKDYLEASKLAEILGRDSWSQRELRDKAIRHFKGACDLPDCLFQVLAGYDTEENAYGMHVDWMRADIGLFQAVSKAYIAVLTEKGNTSEQLNQKITSDLAEFLTYRNLTIDQAIALVSGIPAFDPRNKMLCGSTYIDLAKQYGLKQEVIEYLESLSPAPPPQEVDFSNIDWNEFCGIAELRNNTENLDVQIEKGEFLALDTPEKAYAFLGQNPFIEGNIDFIKGEINTYVKQYQKSMQEAVDLVRQSYTNTLNVFNIVKSRIESNEIQIFYTEDLSLNDHLSDGHKNVGTLIFNGQEVFCKFIAYGLNFNALEMVSDFVIKSRILRNTVPNVVEILPQVIFNKNKRGLVEVGYLMKIEKGEQLRKIKQLSPKEKEIILTQFIDTVDAMLASGYALYDFSDDNVLWDGKNLTFIDLNYAGFKQEALRAADSFSVVFRMKEMLNSKEDNVS